MISLYDIWTICFIVVHFDWIRTSICYSFHFYFDKAPFWRREAERVKNFYIKEARKTAYSIKAAYSKLSYIFLRLVKLDVLVIYKSIFERAFIPILLSNFTAILTNWQQIILKEWQKFLFIIYSDQSCHRYWLHVLFFPAFLLQSARKTWNVTQFVIFFVTVSMRLPILNGILWDDSSGEYRIRQATKIFTWNVYITISSFEVVLHLHCDQRKISIILEL